MEEIYQDFLALLKKMVPQMREDAASVYSLLKQFAYQMDIAKMLREATIIYNTLRELERELPTLEKITLQIQAKAKQETPEQKGQITKSQLQSTPQQIGPIKKKKGLLKIRVKEDRKMIYPVKSVKGPIVLVYCEDDFGQHCKVRFLVSSKEEQEELVATLQQQAYLTKDNGSIKIGKYVGTIE